MSDFSLKKLDPVIFKMTDLVINRFLSKNETGFLVLACHTKSLQSADDFDRVRKFVNYTKNMYGNVAKFTTLYDMAMSLDRIKPKMKKEGKT